MAKPVISVIIPSLNEEKLIGLCLDSVYNQDYDEPYEVIIVDGGSKDKTVKIAKAYGARVIQLRRRGISYARQRGVDAAKGKYIAFTDADTYVASHWLTQVEKSLSKYTCVQGPIYTLEHNILIDSLCAAFLNPINMFSAWFLNRANIVGSNFAVRMSAIKQVGGFDTNLSTGEDIELGTRLFKVGKINFNPTMWVRTSDRRVETMGFGGFVWYSIKNLINTVLFKKPAEYVPVEHVQTVKKRRKARK